jgi:hypothetical protein
VHLDAVGTAYEPAVTNNDSYVAVGVACNDFDADGIPDAQDECPTIQGPPSNNGCPPPGPPAVGGTAGLISTAQSDGGSATPGLVAILATTTIVSIAGGLLVRQLVARRARR